MDKKQVFIKIPRPLYSQLKKIIMKSGFNSVNGFIVFVLRDLMSENTGTKRELSLNNIEKIRNKLKALGYF